MIDRFRVEVFNGQCEPVTRVGNLNAGLITFQIQVPVRRLGERRFRHALAGEMKLEDRSRRILYGVAEVLQLPPHARQKGAVGSLVDALLLPSPNRCGKAGGCGVARPIPSATLQVEPQPESLFDALDRAGGIRDAVFVPHQIGVPGAAVGGVILIALHELISEHMRLFARFVLALQPQILGVRAPPELRRKIHVPQVAKQVNRLAG